MKGKSTISLVKMREYASKAILDVKVLKILLFGSRARNDFQEDSDWDLLIILKKPSYSGREK
jgi:predicted nucleotidyltransferase